MSQLSYRNLTIHTAHMQCLNVNIFFFSQNCPLSRSNLTTGMILVSAKKPENLQKIHAGKKRTCPKKLPQPIFQSCGMVMLSAVPPCRPCPAGSVEI